MGSLREQRDLVESLADKLGEDRVTPLFLMGDPPTMENLTSLQQIAELLGVA